MVTHDLKPGGRVIPVTNANKYEYLSILLFIVVFLVYTLERNFRNFFIDKIC